MSITERSIKECGWQYIGEENIGIWEMRCDIYYIQHSDEMMDGYSTKWRLILPAISQWGTYESRENITIHRTKSGGFVGGIEAGDVFKGTIHTQEEFRQLMQWLSIPVKPIDNGTE